MVEKKIKSAVPVYAIGAVWLIYSFLFPVYKLAHLIIAACLSGLAYFLVSAAMPDKTVLVEAEPAPVDTGDKEVDLLILNGRQYLKKMNEIGKALPESRINSEIKMLEEYGARIFNFVEKDTSKARNIRTFMDYYLPTTLELLENYVSLKTEGIQSENIDRAVKKIEDVMDTIVEAFKNQLDSLYEDKTINIVSEVKAMQAIIKREGLTKSDLTLDINLPKEGDADA